MYSIHTNEIQNDIENVNLFLFQLLRQPKSRVCVSFCYFIAALQKQPACRKRFRSFIKVDDKTSNGLFLVLKEHLKMHKI